MMVQLTEPKLEAIRWLGANEDRFTEAWLEYDRPDAMLYILAGLGMPLQQMVRLRISLLNAPLETGGIAWDLITDTRLIDCITGLRDGKIDASDIGELTIEAGRAAGNATGEAWQTHEAGHRWMIDRIHQEVPDLQGWIDNKSKENE